MRPRRKDERDDDQRRIDEAATGVFFVPSYRGHWVGAVLFCATLVGATMVYSCLPMALSVFAGEAPDGGTAATFFVLYGAMIVLPLIGWLLWGRGWRWMALAVTGVFFACVAWLSGAVGL